MPCGISRSTAPPARPPETRPAPVLGNMARSGRSHRAQSIRLWERRPCSSSLSQRSRRQAPRWPRRCFRCRGLRPFVGRRSNAEPRSAQLAQCRPPSGCGWCSGRPRRDNFAELNALAGAEASKRESRDGFLAIARVANSTCKPALCQRMAGRGQSAEAVLGVLFAPTSAGGDCGGQTVQAAENVVHNFVRLTFSGRREPPQRTSRCGVDWNQRSDTAHDTP